jgi:uncharacterized delta-60 repeat protein
VNCFSEISRNKSLTCELSTLTDIRIVCCETNPNQKEKAMKKATFHTLAGLLAIGLVFGVNFAHAQAGTLDPTFGNGGIVTTSFADGVAGLGAIEQSNGDIVAVAQVDFVNNAGTGIGLAAYTSAGVPDTTFGANGITVTTFPDITFDPTVFAVQTNGDILVGGMATNSKGLTEFGLARYTSSGVLDATFGGGGLVITLVGTKSGTPTALLLQPNGQIVIGGFAADGGKHLALVRYNSDGSLDTTFGTGGVSLVKPKVLGPDTLALLSNGDYLGVGQNAAGKTVVAEFSSTGALQSTVTPGTVVANLSSSQGGFTGTMFPSPTVFQANGDYVVATTGCTFHSECRGTKIGVERFLETGKLDPNFNATVESFNPRQTTSVAEAVALQANGQIVVGGLISADAGGLVRLDSNGTLDTSFGSIDSFGICCSVTTDQTVTGLLIQTDGNIVVIGGLDGDLAVARYLAN